MSQTGLAVSIFTGEGTVPRAGGSGNCLSVSSMPAPWLGFREARGSEGCCSLPGGICADSSQASEGTLVHRPMAAPRQTCPSELPVHLARLLSAALLTLPQSRNFSNINDNYPTITTRGDWEVMECDVESRRPLALSNGRLCHFLAIGGVA